MDLLILRLLHILAGAFWLGAAYTMFLFLQPPAQAVEPDGQRFMLHLLGRRRLPDAVLAAALLTGGAGALLFWRDSGGLQLTWMTQPQGLGFTLGAVSGGIALLLFVTIGYPNTRRIIAIGSRLAAEGRPPGPEEQRTLADVQRRLRLVGLAVIVLLGIAAAAMATARYWGLVL